MGFFENTRKPQGFGGRIMVKMMNTGHSKLAKWGFTKIYTKLDSKVLDIGCGGGANIVNWIKKCSTGHVTGIDYSKVSVEESKKLNAIAIKQGRCDIVYGDVSSMPFDDEAFDCVSAFETVYFWEDLEKCFAEVRRVMKSGGTFFICNESDGTNSKDEKWAKKIGGMKIYNEMQLRTMLEKVGFCDIKSFADAKKHWLCIVAKK